MMNLALLVKIRDQAIPKIGDNLLHLRINLYYLEVKEYLVVILTIKVDHEDLDKVYQKQDLRLVFNHDTYLMVNFKTIKTGLLIMVSPFDRQVVVLIDNKMVVATVINATLLVQGAFHIPCQDESVFVTILSQQLGDCHIAFLSFIQITIALVPRYLIGYLFKFEIYTSSLLMSLLTMRWLYIFLWCIILCILRISYS